jgi:feruloyl esterase
MWDGPRNEIGSRIWFPIERGSDFSVWDGNSLFSLAGVQLAWDEEDPGYYTTQGTYNDALGPSAQTTYNGYWERVAMSAAIQHSISGATTNYAAVAQDGSVRLSDSTDTANNLDALKASGTKLLTVVGAIDQYIMPRGVINYYRTMAARYKLAHDGTGFQGLQQFYRLFHVPGAGHCNISNNTGVLGPWPVAPRDFDALIQWVEQGEPPVALNGTGSEPGNVVLTRPTCPYPQTGVYLGSGNIYEGANWICGGNLEKNVPIQVGTSPPTPIAGALPVPCYDALAKYKQETNAAVNYPASGINPATCGVK